MLSNSDTLAVPPRFPVLADRMTGLTGSTIRQMLEISARPGMISFAGAFPAAELFDVEGIRRAVNEALEQDSRSSLQYGITEGALSLREALCECMRRRGLVIDPDGLMVTTGAQQAIAIMGEALLNTGDTVALERPTYPASIDMVRLRQARIMTAAVDNEGMDVAELENRLRRETPKLLYLVPTFGNPSGAVLSLNRRMRILELAVHHDFLVLEDDPYSELYFDVPPPLPMIALAREVPGAAAHCAYCSSLSKVVAPGLRLGWLIAPREILRAATVIKQGQDAHTSTLAQQTALCYLRSGCFERNLPRLRASYRARAETMATAIGATMPGVLEYASPKGGMFLWAGLRDGRDAGRLLDVALRQGVAFVPGVAFMAEHAVASKFRLSYSSPAPNEIKDGVTRLAAAVNGMRQC